MKKQMQPLKTSKANDFHRFSFFYFITKRKIQHRNIIYLIAFNLNYNQVHFKMEVANGNILSLRQLTIEIMINVNECVKRISVL